MNPTIRSWSATGGEIARGGRLRVMETGVIHARADEGTKSAGFLAEVVVQEDRWPRLLDARNDAEGLQRPTTVDVMPRRNAEGEFDVQMLVDPAGNTNQQGRRVANVQPGRLRREKRRCSSALRR
jgi:hypothetical protein